MRRKRVAGGDIVEIVKFCPSPRPGPLQEGLDLVLVVTYHQQ